MIRIVAGLLFLGVLFAVLITPAILYILTLSRALNKCAFSSRTIQPGTLWLLLIPLVNLIWHFVVVNGMAQSLGNEFRTRNLTSTDPEPGKSIGIAMCVCGACGLIPLLGILAGIAYLVLWVIYWLKIAEFSRRLDFAPTAMAIPVSNSWQ
jgi:hypothetical protein